MSDWHGLSINNHSGFSLTFANGYRVSVQFGPCNYCKDYPESMPIDFDAPKNTTRWASPNAEVAVLSEHGFYVDDEMREALGFDGDEVQGWKTPDEVAWLMSHVVNLDNSNGDKR